MAEVTYDDGRKETLFPEPPKGETNIRAPSAFERYRGSRERVTGAPFTALGMPETGKAFGQMLTPQTGAEQGIEIGTLMMPGVGKGLGFAERVLGAPVAKLGTLAQRGIRSALPAIGGVAGDIA